MGWGRLEIKRQLEKRGYVDLGVIYPKLDTISVAKKIGEVLQISGLSEVQNLSPRNKEDFPKNTYSGNYGKDEFPLHTDLAHWYQPPRYFLLRCVIPDPEVGTLFLHFDKALRKVSASTQERALFKPRRRLDNKMFFLRLAQNNIHRWDPLFLRPENREAEEVTAAFHSFNAFQFDEVFLKMPAQTILVDNWKVLHGRNSVKNESARLVERVYLSEINL